MSKTKLILLFIFISQLLFSQNKGELITMEFKNMSRLAAIHSIEKSTSYRFYFDMGWIESDPTLISGNYSNVTIESLLAILFNNSDLKFFIQKNKIILTKSVSIYDTVSPYFFNKEVTENATDNDSKVFKSPIFHQLYDSIAAIRNNTNYGITIIGRNKNNQGKKQFTLSGYIKNSETNKGIYNISIRVRNKKISTITDPDGYYQLVLPYGISYIETESLNHQKIVKGVIMYDDGKLNLNISELSNDLKEIIVKGKSIKSVRSTITGVSTIDVEGIKNVPLVFGERDIFRVATTLPGIKTTGEGSAGFNVRGGKDDQNLIIIDNAVLYNSSHFLGFFSAVNPYTTSKVDIYKGSIPSQFGGRLSSVFDVTTKKASTTKVTGEGGIGIVASNLSFGIPIVKDKSSLMVGVRGTYSGWVLRSLDEENLKKSEASFYDATAKYSHKINEKNNIQSTLYYSHDAFSVSSDSLYKYNNRLFSLKWDHSIDSKNKAALILTNSHYKFNIEYRPETNKAFNFGYTINETQGILNLKHVYNDKHSFNYGISSKLYNTNPGYLDPTSPGSILIPVEIADEKGLESAVFFSDNYTVTDKLLLNIGFRYSNFLVLGPSTVRTYAENLPLNEATVIKTQSYSNNEVIKTYGGFEPRISARYLFTDDFSIKASYDKTFQFIHLLTNNTTQSPMDTWKLSDFNIAPQEAQQFSIGLFKNLDNDAVEISLEGYYKKSKNLIDFKVGGQVNLNQNIETEILQGPGQAYGIELLLRKQIGKLNGWIGYTYSRTFIKLSSKFNDEKVNNGDYFPTNFDKPHEASAVLNYKFTKLFSFSTNFIYQTGRPITYPSGTYNYGNANYTYYSDRNKFRIPDYYRLDIGINIEGNRKIKSLVHNFWNISIYNVLGRNNPYSIFFIKDKGKIQAYKTSIFTYPIPSITYNFTF